MTYSLVSTFENRFSPVSFSFHQNHYGHDRFKLKYASSQRPILILTSQNQNSCKLISTDFGFNWNIYTYTRNIVFRGISYRIPHTAYRLPHTIRLLQGDNNPFDFATSNPPERIPYRYVHGVFAVNIDFQQTLTFEF